MSRIRTIKADGGVVDDFELMFRDTDNGQLTWNEAIQKSLKMRDIVFDMVKDYETQPRPTNKFIEDLKCLL